MKKESKPCLEIDVYMQSKFNDEFFEILQFENRYLLLTIWI